MLCDDLVTATMDGYHIGPVLPRLGASHKFVLSPEFAAVAESLADDYTGLVRVFNYCRLPYRETWIEVLQVDRPRFVAAGLHLPALQRLPKRVGFLLSATRDDLSAWKTHLFWSIESDGKTTYGSAPFALQVDMRDPLYAVTTSQELTEIEKQVTTWYRPHPGWEKADIAVRLMMTNHTGIVPTDLVLTFLDDLEDHEKDPVYDLLFEMGRADWAGECAYMLAVVGLINARNAVETEAVDRSKINKQRRRKGKLPLFEHKILKIAGRQQKRVYESSGDHAAMRGHFVRGHFKARKHGIFFWSPHTRGDFTRGMVNKDYELK